MVVSVKRPYIENYSNLRVGNKRLHISKNERENVANGKSIGILIHCKKHFINNFVVNHIYFCMCLTQRVNNLILKFYKKNCITI